jgi:hypothetical protein
MKRSFYRIGALFGLLTSLTVMAFAYLGNAILTLPFFPFNLFDWLTRHLPGAVIHATIQLMVSAITALGLGPIDRVAKVAEQIQALILVSLIGISFGLALTAVRQYRQRWLLWAGILGGLILWLGLVIVEISLQGTSPALPVSLAWLLGLLVIWGWVLSRLLAGTVREVIPPASPEVLSGSNQSRIIDRRKFLVLAGSGFASLVVLALGL